MANQPREEIPPSKLFAPVLPYQSGLYMTVFNIIQALALGFWANEVREIIARGDVNWAGALRSTVVLVIILLVWHHSSEVQYLWPLSWRDTTNPFLIGVSEFLMTFSINPSMASPKLFMATIAWLQIAGAFAYLGNLFQRQKDLTRRIYQDFYRDCPQFGNHLIGFLEKYDLKQVIMYLGSAGISLIFLAMTVILPWQGYDILFSIFCLVDFTIGEILGNFQAELRKDALLRSYFQ